MASKSRQSLCPLYISGLGMQKHQTSAPISLVRVPTLSSGRFPIIQDPERDNNRKNKCHPHSQVLTLETAIRPQLPFLSPVALTCQQNLPRETDHPLTTKEMSTTQELYSPQHTQTHTLTHTHTYTHTHAHTLTYFLVKNTRCQKKENQMQCIGLTKDGTDVKLLYHYPLPTHTHT